MRAAYNISERNYTAALSNIGRVDMPAEVQPYISYFDVLTSTKNCSYTSVPIKTRWRCRFPPRLPARCPTPFFQQLTALGIGEICSNIEESPGGGTESMKYCRNCQVLIHGAPVNAHCARTTRRSPLSRHSGRSMQITPTTPPSRSRCPKCTCFCASCCSTVR